MHPFFSNQISQIRSVCIISYLFHMGDLLLYKILEVQLLSRETFSNSLYLSMAPFFPSLSHCSFSHLSYCFLPQRFLYAKYVKNCFISCLNSLCILYAATSVCVCLCVSFSLFSRSFLPSAAVMARDESTIGQQYFSED